MSKKSNEEKLKILQERLATIQKNKKERTRSREKENTETNPSIEEEQSTISNPEPKNQKNGFKVGGFLLLLTLLTTLSIFGYYFIKNDMQIEKAINHIKKDISILTQIGENDKEDIKKNPDDSPNQDTYHMNKLKTKYNKDINTGFEGFIIVLNNYSIKDTSLAIEEINRYKNEYTIEARLNCNKLFLPDASSSDEELIQTYLGPFETKAEAKQYLESPASIKGDIYKLQ